MLFLFLLQLEIAPVAKGDYKKKQAKSTVENICGAFDNISEAFL